MMWRISELISVLFVLLGFATDSYFEFRTISEKEEAYVYDHAEYRIVKTRATWLEAQILCEENLKNGSLATAETNDIQEILADILAETNFDTEQVWVGGFKNGSEFHWLNGKPFTAVDINRKINRSVEDSDAERDLERNCIIFERKNHDIPHLINMDCFTPRPYICQTHGFLRRNFEKVNWMRGQDSEYAIIRQTLTWKKAVIYCKEHLNAHIATFRNIKEIDVVARYMLIGRPSLENAWIGGHFDTVVNEWKFLPNGKIIPKERDESTKFPPWHVPYQASGCLSLDRHLSNINDFAPFECSNLKAFVCERPIPGTLDELFSKQGVIYYLGMENVTWNDAKKKCKNVEGILAKITNAVLKDVIYYMGEKAIEIKHIWIGGLYDENENCWKWIKDNSTIPFEVQDDSYPPWYDSVHGPEENCLNLDRENHNQPMFYGIACGAHQPFICEKDKINK